MTLISQSLISSQKQYLWHIIKAEWLGYDKKLVKIFFRHSKKPPCLEAKGPLLGASKINLYSFETKEQRDRFKIDHEGL